MADIKTLLRYPGGKQRAVKILADYVPQSETELCSPFFGGGSFEMYCASVLNMQVHGYDNFLPLVEFWRTAMHTPAALAGGVAAFLPKLPRKRFYELQKEQCNLPTQLERAAAFYVINRASFSGCTLSGGMSPGHLRFTPSAVARLRNFPGRLLRRRLSVRQMDFVDSITAHPRAMIYADPPYLLKNQNLYGARDCRKNFAHGDLRDMLMARGGKWLLSYNDSPSITDLYKGNILIKRPQWRYGMSRNKNSRELLIMSEELAAKLELSSGKGGFWMSARQDVLMGGYA